ncbi:MAG: D-alanyl-D-alanine carboxypeptidase family protein [Streptosporangiaceae bacterium]
MQHRTSQCQASQCQAGPDRGWRPRTRRAALAALAAGLAVMAGLGPAAGAAAAAGTVGASGTLAASGTTAGGTTAGGTTARADVGGARLASPGVVVNYPARSARRVPRVPARAWVIADAGTGQVLAAKDAHGEFPPASTLKVLTAITLIPRLNPGALVRASRQATSVVPNVVGLIRGRQYRVAALFRALLMISANDAAVALAQATGSYSRGIGLMNAEAHRLQAYDVLAKDPNGLPAAGQHVSAYDLALIARQALRSPAFMRYDSTLVARFLVRPRHKVTLVNQNTLLTDYRGGIGGKIGWTEAAHATYIGLARRHGVTLIVTLLHCTPLQEITSGERLLNWGFATDGKVAPVGTLVPPRPAARPAAAGASPSPAATAARSAAAAKPGPGRAARAGAAAGTAGSASPGLPVAPLAIAAGCVAAVAVGLGWLARRQRRRRAAS